ncbi:MAG: type I-E CRISPR-associated protein Cse2/CasB [Candidatus Omnitrophica bacterium]|nr:type I-E CRISPR-associated protein Cse2/CasB [Candidatus Omnitrophota bacterium]MBU4479216.1 type I-E CRISPR-associated protein Cse2/CasB [Candidatus Omnitrophota bacterium]
MSSFDVGVVLRWYKALEHDSGARAELRRAHNPTEVVFLPAYHRLYAMLEASNIDKEALASVAGLCAHVKENWGGGIVEQMAECKAGSKNPKISSLRFRKLLAIKDREDLYHTMIRIIRQLNGAVNVVDLAKTVYWWNEKTKKELAYAYYDNASTKK